MNYSIIFYIMGWILNFEGIFMLLPLGTALIYGEGNGVYFFLCILLCGLMGFLLVRKKPGNMIFFAKEGFVMVALSWILLSLVGALPMWASGEIPAFTDALFETVSGFTTTGASIVPNVEVLSRCVNLWRCFTHWIGGMGVLVFILAILPLTGGQNIFLMKAESPGPSVGKLVPKLQKTAKYLYVLYFALTLMEMLLLLIAGMPFFDAICASFGTAGTGGFGIKADSIAGYSSLIQNIITVFMVLFGINFNFYFLLLIRRPKEAFRMEEVRLYLGIFVVSSVAVAINLYGSSVDILNNFKHASFQVASIMTTTGYATADFNLWPEFSRTLLVLLMFMGACAGSTGGGMKVSRIWFYLKSLKREMAQTIHPRAVKTLTMDGKVIPKDVLRTANMFLIAYMTLFVLSIIIISLDGFDLITNFTAVASAMNNIGPGLEMVGPTGNFAAFSPFSKCILMFDMLAGRLEMFPMLLLLMPGTWKRK